MSHRSIEQALVTLLPALAEELPQELIQLASSLLAQSRSSGTSLKPEMEIARPYACAEIACKRLAKLLNLPSTSSRPPCPPRIYKKLYAYLEQSLTSTTSSSKRPAADIPQRRVSTRIQNKTYPSATDLIQTSKPISTSTHLETVSNTTSTSNPANRSTLPQKPQAKGPPLKRSAHQSSTGTIKDAPKWTIAVIRKLCHTFSIQTATSSPNSRPKSAPTFVPHIFSGLSTILSELPNLDFNDELKAFMAPALDHLHKPNITRGQSMQEHSNRISTLIIAVYLLVLQERVCPVDESKPADESTELDIDTLEEIKSTALDCIGLPKSDVYGNETSIDVNRWLDILFTDDWVNQQEWFRNIPPPSIQGDPDTGTKRRFDEEIDGGDQRVTIPSKRSMNHQTRQDVIPSLSARDRYILENTLLPGLGTMMHAQIHWLSDEKKYHFASWRDRILLWIEQIEVA
ncbi:hypothetical protein FQN57_002543 [Myotisia sp. PD_48]|nr:hypothetical protein FQN57_002543 [Myotisia sp. PD_48]